MVFPSKLVVALKYSSAARVSRGGGAKYKTHVVAWVVDHAANRAASFMKISVGSVYFR